jgi:type II secretory pathway pseudopilin PulG
MRHGICGASLLELMFVLTLLVTMTAVTVPTVMAGVHHARASGAARHLAGRLRLARMEAVKRSAFVGLRFEATSLGYRYGTYVDGNGNGLRNADIRQGTDRPIAATEALSDLFPGVAFGLREGVPYVDGAATGGAADPVRVGTSNIMSFSPLGSATAGTLYVLGRGDRQYAVRVLGVTGRTRVMRFDFGAGRWVSQ